MVGILFNSYRGITHYVDTDEDIADIANFRAVCGHSLYYRFADDPRPYDGDIPDDMCSKCYRFLTGEQKPRQPSKPVKLELKAIKGATEGWRPKWMKSSD